MNAKRLWTLVGALLLIFSTASLSVSAQGPEVTPEATPNPAYEPFIPDPEVWDELPVICPTTADFLEAHNLTSGQVVMQTVARVSWEPCIFVVELKPEFYGEVVLPLMAGYAYTLAPVDTDVIDMWGGDPAVMSITLQWGFTARWWPSYAHSENGIWLDIQNSCEWVVRDFRFGLYWHLTGIGLPQNGEYNGRVGPYTTQPGNVSCIGWVPPALDQIVPNDYLQATALLGGLAVESQWQHSPDKANWAWRYNSTDGKFKWQTVYMPQASLGYVELWVNGGPKKFYATDIGELMLGNLNVEAFSYHSDPTK